MHTRTRDDGAVQGRVAIFRRRINVCLSRHYLPQKILVALQGYEVQRRVPF